jgi:predicted dehydrogenase
VTQLRAVVTVAVIGTGSAGLRHLDVFKGLGVKPLAVPIRSGRAAFLRSSGYLAVDSLDEAVKAGARVCVIASDTARHQEDTVAAIERGLDVLVEKPVARNAREARLLTSRAQELGRKIYVGCVMRFSDSLNTFSEWLGKVGPIHSVHLECRSYLPDWRSARPYRESYSAMKDEGGVLRDLIHEIDYAGWIWGWPAAVQAKVENLGRLSIEAEELAELAWDLGQGSAMTISLDYLSRPPRRRANAFGELGTVEWDGVQGTAELSLSDSAPQVFRSQQTRTDMFSSQARALMACVGGAFDPRLATLEDGIRALAVCDAARRAALNKREELVEYL